MDITSIFVCNFHTFLGNIKNDNKRTAKGCHINNGTDSLCEYLNIIRYCNVSVVASLVLSESLPKRSHFTCLNPKKQYSLQSRSVLQWSVRRQGICGKLGQRKRERE